MSVLKFERILKEIKSRQFGDVQHVQEICKEDQLLQQEKVDLKNSFLFQEKRRLYLQYLGKDRCTWPDVKQTDEKLKASRDERIKVKNRLEEEKDKVYDILQKVKDEHNLLQEKITKLEEKQEVFESKKKLFESRRKLDPDTVELAISKCEQAIVKIDAEISNQRAELEKREKEIARMKAELNGRGKSSGPQQETVERLKKVIKLLQTISGLKVHVSGPEQLTLEFQHQNTEMTSPEESLNLEMTLTFNTGCHGDVRLSEVKVSHEEVFKTGSSGKVVAVNHGNTLVSLVENSSQIPLLLHNLCHNTSKISVDHFQIKDIIDTAIAINDVPFLVLSVQERWNQHFPLLSEMDILNKNHAIDWIQEQCRLRVLVGKCGKIMFTLSVPKDYPSVRGISLLDSYGVDNVVTEDLPDKDSTLLQWVLYLEQKYGDC